MSAYVVDPAHIDVMLSIAINGPREVRPGRWVAPYVLELVPDAEERGPITAEVADLTGRALLRECVASVSYRYKSTSAELPVPMPGLDPERYEWTDFGRLITAVEALCAIDGYEYQSCEHPGWWTSGASHFCHRFRKALVRCLPGYEEAEWEWTGRWRWPERADRPGHTEVECADGRLALVERPFDTLVFCVASRTHAIPPGRLMKRLTDRLSYANVMATLAVFISLGGASYAAMKLPSNSVGTKQIQKGAVSTTKIRDKAITGPKVDLPSLGTVPDAAHALTADSAKEAEHAKGAAAAADASALGGQPPMVFAQLFTSHTTVEATKTDLTRWIPVTGAGPTAASQREVEMITPIWGPKLYASDFTVYSLEGAPNVANLDVQLYVNRVPAALSCSAPPGSPCTNGNEAGVEVGAGSVLAIRIHEEPEGHEIPAFALEVSFALGPKPRSAIP
jgi:hypothetical protein